MTTEHCACGMSKDEYCPSCDGKDRTNYCACYPDTSYDAQQQSTLADYWPIIATDNKNFQIRLGNTGRGLHRVLEIATERDFLDNPAWKFVCSADENILVLDYKKEMITLPLEVVFALARHVKGNHG